MIKKYQKKEVADYSFLFVELEKLWNADLASKYSLKPQKVQNFLLGQIKKQFLDLDVRKKQLSRKTKLKAILENYKELKTNKQPGCRINYRIGNKRRYCLAYPRMSGNFDISKLPSEGTAINLVINQGHTHQFLAGVF